MDCQNKNVDNFLKENITNKKHKNIKTENNKNNTCDISNILVEHTQKNLDINLKEKKIFFAVIISILIAISISTLIILFLLCVLEWNKYFYC